MALIHSRGDKFGQSLLLERGRVTITQAFFGGFALGRTRHPILGTKW